ncbi:transposase [Lacunimicrobium album]
MTATGRRSPDKQEAADTRPVLGRGRGELTTKVHAAVNAEGRVVRRFVVAAQSGDDQQGERLLDDLLAKALQHVVADTAYDRDAIRKRIQKMGAKACIKLFPKRKIKQRDDKQWYRNCKVIERGIGQFEINRRLATHEEGNPGQLPIQSARLTLDSQFHRPASHSPTPAEMNVDSIVNLLTRPPLSSPVRHQNLVLPRVSNVITTFPRFPS